MAAVWNGDFPDPFVLYAGDGYIAFATNGAGRNVQVLTALDLATWNPNSDALPELPGWAEPGNTWSPSVLRRPGGYVLFYTAREPRSGRQAISVASAEHPIGPFRDQRQGPLIFQRELGGSIDPSPFVDVDGRAYLLWKADSNAVRQQTSLWGQELSEDGMSLVGSPVRLLQGDARWEHPLIEAPSLVCRLNRYYLFYSANWWNTDRYGIGYAVGSRPLGPFTKETTEAAWMSSRPDAAGPGGQEFFYNGAGALQMAYHAWHPRRVGYPRGARTLHIRPVTFVDDRPVSP